jgi:hypothetical protein
MSKIFESPDKGVTIYSRTAGSTERATVQEDLSTIEQLREDQMWGEIRRMARRDEGLRELLERAIIYYKLKQDHDR